MAIGFRLFCDLIPKTNENRNNYDTHENTPAGRKRQCGWLQKSYCLLRFDFRITTSLQNIKHNKRLEIVKYIVNCAVYNPVIDHSTLYARLNTSLLSSVHSVQIYNTKLENAQVLGKLTRACRSGSRKSGSSEWRPIFRGKALIYNIGPVLNTVVFEKKSWPRPLEGAPGCI